MAEKDPATRGEGIGILGHVLARAPAQVEARFLQASFHAALGAVEEARAVLRDASPRTDRLFEAWRSLAEAFPGHAGVRLDFVDALTAERRIDDALEEVRRVLSLPGTEVEAVTKRVETILDLSQEYAPALYLLADARHAARDLDGEIAACRRVLRLAPDEAEVVLQRLDLVLDEDPECRVAALEVVRLVRLHHRVERVGPEGRRALDASRTPEEVAEVAEVLGDLSRDLGRDPGFLGVHAEALTRAGRTGEAVAAWRKLLERDEKGAGEVARGVERLTEAEGEVGVEALRVHAEACIRDGAPERAAAAVRAFSDRHPAGVAEAVRFYRRILDAHPRSHEAAAGLAGASVETGDAEGAVDAWLHDLRQHPDRRREIGQELVGLRMVFPASASVPLAQAEFIHLPLDLLDDAADAMEAALDIEPACHGRVRILAAVLLERDPRSAKGTRAHGRALVEGGRLAEATEAFRVLADLDPRLREDALRGLDGVLAAGPGLREAAFHRARILLGLGRGKEAVRQAEALAAAVPPDDPEELRTLHLLADAREATGDFDGALAALRDAAARHGRDPSVAPRIRANGKARLEARAAELRSAPEGRRGESDGDLAETLLELGRPAEALAAVGPLPEKGKALARWKVLRGRAFLDLGSGMNAQAELEDAFAIKGVPEAKDDIGRDALYFGGLAFLRNGEILKAIRRFEQLAAVAPAHRRVREALDRVYDDDRRGLERPLEVTAVLDAIPVPGVEEADA